MLSTVYSAVSIAAIDAQAILEYLLHDAETVRIVSVEDVRAHKREDGHDILNDCLGSQTS
jgi:hypothetical protein